ncbi:MAG: site-specific DNA-methyltransferase [Bacteroidia bacterium]
MVKPYYSSRDDKFKLYEGDSNYVLSCLTKKFDMVFADPPYFLSNDGLTIEHGKPVSVNKGAWDKEESISGIHRFNNKWLSEVRKVMKDNATIFVSGTSHNIFSVGLTLQQLGFKILNTIIWEKSNPPPHLACRRFTHSNEIIIWARKLPKVAHYFDYSMMKLINDNKQMKDVWNFPAIGKWEKSCGKHPTQKPLSLLSRIIVASTRIGDTILDPFAGSCSTGIAANLLNRKFVGVELEQEYLELSKKRRKELLNQDLKDFYLSKIKGFENINGL